MTNQNIYDMKKILLFAIALLLICLSSINAYAAATSPTAYVYKSGSKMTFYYDDKKDNRGKINGKRIIGTKIITVPAFKKLIQIEDVREIFFSESFSNYKPSSTAEWFSNGSNIETIEGLENLNTTNVTTMKQMFANCNKLTTLDLSSFNTLKVINMQDMFSGCTNLVTIYVGQNWTTDAVSSGASMFANCRSLVGGRGTTYDSSHIGPSYAHVDGGPDVPGYMTLKETDDDDDEGNSEWTGATAIYKDGTLSFEYTGYVNAVFDGEPYPIYGNYYYRSETDNRLPAWCEHQQEITKVVFNTSFKDFLPTTTAGWFYGCSNLKTIEGIDCLNTSQTTNMSAMFRGCSSLQDIDFGFMNTAKATKMRSMMQGCSLLTELELCGFETSSVADMNSMFADCSSLETIYVSELWSTAKVTDSNNMFSGCKALVGMNGTAYNTGHTDKAYALIDGGSSKPGYLSDWPTGFTGAETGTLAYTVLNGNTLTFYYDDRMNSRTGKKYAVTNHVGYPSWYGVRKQFAKAVFDESFKNYRPTTTAYWFCSSPNLKTVEGIENLNTSEVVTMADMFRFCGALTSLDLRTFDTSKVANMSCLFCLSGLQSVDVSNFNTENVTNMEHMFHGCPLTTLDLRTFNTAKVRITNIMFEGCNALQTIYVSRAWSMESVTSSSYMFSGCYFLEGGKGTKYDDAHTDHEYACIDGGLCNPGYLTSDDQVDTRKAYAVYKDDVLTFYYDDNINCREGIVYRSNLYDIYEAGDSLLYKNNKVGMVVFDTTFREASNAGVKDFGLNILKRKTNDDIPAHKVLSISTYGPDADEHEVVDLGLSVGWAACNIGASSKEQAGSYFAWGETQPKAVYSKDTYKFGNPYNKYNETDGLTTLELEDDAAHVQWGGNWRLPTRQEEQEMYEMCQWTWTQVNGVDGFNVTGPNGNSIFLPTTGLYDGDSPDKVKRGSTGGWYWSDTTNGATYSCGICFPQPDYLYKNVPNHERYDGHAIRPVNDSKIGGEKGIVVNMSDGSIVRVSQSELLFLEVYTKRYKSADVNGDGVVTAADIAAIVSYLARKGEVSKEAADVNGDGRVTIADIVAVTNMLAGM